MKDGKDESGKKKDPKVVSLLKEFRQVIVEAAKKRGLKL